MEPQPRWNGEDRRASPRVAADGELRAAVIDEHGQSRKLLKQAQAVNVCGGGIAFTSADGCEVGDSVNLRTADNTAGAFSVQIVGVSRRGDGRSELRGKLIKGAVPACLMYGW
ncbi:MAG: hypothetical protein R3C45_21960 [Phycisphaerales bacterium]